MATLDGENVIYQIDVPVGTATIDDATEEFVWQVPAEIFGWYEIRVDAMVSDDVVINVRRQVFVGRPGDVNTDNRIDAFDIDAVFRAISEGSNHALYDLTADMSVNQDDVDELVLNILGSLYGDANLDRVVDGSDFNLWNDHKFQSLTGWSQGDFTGDATTDGSDFNVWSQNRFRSAVAATIGIVRAEDVLRNSEPKAPLEQIGLPLAASKGWRVPFVRRVNGHDQPFVSF